MQFGLSFIPGDLSHAAYVVSLYTTLELARRVGFAGIRHVCAFPRVDSMLVSLRRPSDYLHPEKNELIEWGQTKQA